MNLGSTGSALATTGANFTAMAEALPTVWTTEPEGTADQASSGLRDMAACHDVQAQGTRLMSEQVGHMITAVSEGLKLAAGILGMIVDEFASVPIAKAVEWLVSGVSKIQRLLHLVELVVTTLRKLENVIPPLLSAAKALNALMFTAKAIMGVVAAGQHGAAGGRVNETAGAAYA
ncbi:hypothetical protein ACQP1U_05655 [Actinomycetota bacterium]